jgi:TonB family protein
MLGNVQEWCLDWHGTYPGGSVSDYVGPESFSGRVVRGGSWGSNAQTVRAAYRDWWPADHRNFSVGFRVALTTPAVASAGGGSAALHPKQAPKDAGPDEIGVGMSDLFDMAELDQPPVPTSRASPIYPFAMRRTGITGEVVVGFIVDSSGNVVQARVVRSSRSEFEQPALQAVSRWKFQPGRKDGRAVNTRLQVPISFTLDD